MELINFGILIHDPIKMENQHKKDLPLKVSEDGTRWNIICKQHTKCMQDTYRLDRAKGHPR